MPQLRRKGIILVAVFGLLAVSGLAVAQPVQEDDTVFNFGYDEDGQVLVFGTSDIENEAECTLENGDTEVTYGETDDGVIAVENGGEDCELHGVEVTGPNGQINHGMFMRAFNLIYGSVFDGKGRGCLVRHLAQSDLGKGDQQIRVPDADPDFESVLAGDTALIEFSTALTRCQHGNGDGNGVGGGKPEWAGPPEHAGRPEHAGPPEHAGQQGKPESPGNSGSAPGRNK